MSFLSQSTPQDAQQHRLAWIERAADLYTPVRIFLSLRAAGYRPCLLESAPGPERLTRYSFIGVESSASFRAAHDGAQLTIDGQTQRLQSQGVDALREMVQRFRLPEPPAHLPPFCGGWIGSFSYEWAGALEPRTELAPTQLHDEPYATFELFERMVVLDHAAQKLILICTCRQGEAEFGAAMASLASVAQDLDRAPAALEPFSLTGSDFVSSMSQASFMAGVEKLQAAIRNGEIFQAVLSQCFEQSFQGDPFFVYRVLAVTNPSPHMFYFESGDLTLIGSSPERLISVRAGLVESRPIAGTRPRHEDDAIDQALGQELCEDEKERAEHEMLVDLARNDVGRIATVGSVKVVQHACLEKFQAVQHLVSRVTCQLDDSKDALDALAASFPAGTVSGAPKIRAMKLIAQIEPQARRHYAGCFGYVDHRNHLDMTLNIRTVFVHGNKLRVQAGAGIVLDSDPKAEFDETLHKAKAVFQAVSSACSTNLAPRKEIR